LCRARVHTQRNGQWSERHIQGHHRLEGQHCNLYRHTCRERRRRHVEQRSIAVGHGWHSMLRQHQSGGGHADECSRWAQRGGGRAGVIPPCVHTARIQQQKAKQHEMREEKNNKNIKTKTTTTTTTTKKKKTKKKRADFSAKSKDREVTCPWFVSRCSGIGFCEPTRATCVVSTASCELNSIRASQ
jgi:hypothetical protein